MMIAVAQVSRQKVVRKDQVKVGRLLAMNVSTEDTFGFLCVFVYRTKLTMRLNNSSVSSVQECSTVHSP